MSTDCFLYDGRSFNHQQTEHSFDDTASLSSSVPFRRNHLFKDWVNLSLKLDRPLLLLLRRGV